MGIFWILGLCSTVLAGLAGAAEQAEERWKTYRLELPCVRESYPGSHDDTAEAETEAPPVEAKPVITDEGTKGPTYFADISPPWMKQVLLADPVGVDPRMQPVMEKIDLPLVHEILGTLKTFPTQKPPGICIEDLQHRKRGRKRGPGRFFGVKRKSSSE